MSGLAEKYATLVSRAADPNLKDSTREVCRESAQRMIADGEIVRRGDLGRVPPPELRRKIALGQVGVVD